MQAENPDHTEVTQAQVEKPQSNYQSQKEQAKKERKILRAIEAIEDELANMEEEIALVETQLTLPDVFENHEEVQKYHGRLLELEEQQSTLMNQWEEEHLALEELE